MGISMFTEWCIVEMMGHRRIAGHVTERTIAGHGFLEVRIPSEPPMMQLIQPSSIYALTPCTEETARAYAKTLSPEPLTLFDARRMLAVDAPPASEAAPPWSNTVSREYDDEDYFDRKPDDDDLDDDPSYDYENEASPTVGSDSSTLPNVNVEVAALATTVEGPDATPTEVGIVGTGAPSSADAKPTAPVDPDEVLF